MRKEASNLHPVQSRERRQDPDKAKERVSIAEAEFGLGQVPVRRWEAEPVESRAKERAMPVNFSLLSDEQKTEAKRRLPTWVQSYIAKLEKDNTDLRQERAEMTDEDSPIWHTPDYQTKLHLPKRTTVVFKLEGGELEVELREDQVKVFANGKSNGRLYIMPEITNSFTIGFKEH